MFRRNKSTWNFLHLLAAIFLIAVCGTAAFAATTRTYTTTADFAGGELSGVDTAVPNQLQLSPQGGVLPFIWVPNNDQTVSKLNTNTGAELGRYYVGPPGYYPNPSRTTVDLHGSVWVGNRQLGTVVKIGLLEAGECVDRNNSGTIETSRDGDSDGNITSEEMLSWGVDECVLFEINLGTDPVITRVPDPNNNPGPYDTNYWGAAPRGLAVDANNHVWVGTNYWNYGGVGAKFFHINGMTGEILKSVPTGHSAYGATIDKNGVIWSPSVYGGTVLRLDPAYDPANPQQELLRVIDLKTYWYVQPPGYEYYNFYDWQPYAYGITADHLNHVFVSGWLTQRLTKFDVDVPYSNDPVEWSYCRPTELSGARGVAVTADNDVWVVSTNGGAVVRYDNNGNLKATITGFNSPTGVAVDAAGKVWVTDYYSGYIHRIDPATNAVDLSKDVLNSGGHYAYSDMTGSVARTITTRMGNWTVTTDSGSPATTWGALAWNSTQPAGTSLVVKVRSSEDQANWSAWEPATSAAPLAATPNGRYLQTQAIFQSDSDQTSPILYDLSVTSTANPPPPPTATIYQPAVDLTIQYGDSVYFQGSAASFASYEWFCNGERISLQQAFTTTTLPLGYNLIEYKITDWAGQSSTDSVHVTVLESYRVDLALEGGDVSFLSGGTPVANPSPGETITIKAVVHNLSEVVSSPVTVRAFDNCIGPENQIPPAEGVTISAIPGPGTGTASLNWTIPSEGSNGYHVIRVQVAKDGNETYLPNNETTRFLVVGTMDTGNAWIAIDPLNVQSTVSAGTLFGVGGTALYRMEPAWNVPLPVMGATVRARFLEVEGQTWETVTNNSGGFGMNVTAPLIPRDYTLRVEVSDGTLTASLDKTITVPRPLPADLVVSAIGLANGVAYASLNETVTATICNVGQTGIPSGTVFNNLLTIYDDQNTTIFQNTKPLDGLAAGACASVTFTDAQSILHWPAGDQYYRLVVMADSDDAVPEYSESNNTRTEVRKIYTEAVDFQALELSQACKVISVRFRNHGGITSDDGWQVQCFADDSTVPYSTTLLPPVGGQNEGYGQWASCGLYDGGGMHRITVKLLCPNYPSCTPTQTDPHPEDNEISGDYDFDRGADLAVTDLWVNGLRYTGSNIAYQANTSTFNAEVRNLGCNAGSGTLQFYVDNLPIGSALQFSLSPGQADASLSVNQVFDLPDWPAATNYQLKARITPNNSDAESGNNLGTETLWIFPSQPDYQILSSDITFTPNPAGPGAPVRIFARVCNVGIQIGTGFQVRFTEEGGGEIGVLTDYPVTLGVDGCLSDIVPRDAGGSEVTWSSQTLGDHPIVVEVFAITGNQHETNVSNNSATSTVRVEVLTVNLIKPNGGEVITSGSTYRIMWETPNLGTKFTIYYRLNDGASWTRIARGVTNTYYDWPTRSTDNSTTCKVKIDELSGTTIVGTDISSNYFTLKPDVKPDLIISSITVPTTVTRGQSYTIKWVAKNQGTGNAGTFKVGFYLSTDNAINPASDFPLTGDATVASLAAGASTPQTSTAVTIPTDAPLGKLYIGAFADYTALVVESNDSNNGKAAKAASTVR